MKFPGFFQVFQTENPIPGFFQVFQVEWPPCQYAHKWEKCSILDFFSLGYSLGL